MSLRLAGAASPQESLYFIHRLSVGADSEVDAQPNGGETTKDFQDEDHRVRA